MTIPNSWGLTKMTFLCKPMHVIQFLTEHLCTLIPASQSPWGLRIGKNGYYVYIWKFHAIPRVKIGKLNPTSIKRWICKAPIKRGFMKHCHIHMEKTKMCICVYVCLYEAPNGFAKTPPYGLSWSSWGLCEGPAVGKKIKACMCEYACVYKARASQSLLSLGPPLNSP